MSDSASESWKCGRCDTVIPSPGDDRPPTTCLHSLGGCKRVTDWCGHDEKTEDCDACENGTTRFFPASWGDEKIRAHMDIDTNAGRILFDRLVDTWQRYIEFGNPWHPRLLSLFVFQSYFYKSLPAVFYIGLTGPKATAKTAVLEILRDLCYNATMTFNTSLPAMARKLDIGCTLLVDEMDEMENDKKDLVSGAARGGYRPGNVYLRWDMKNHKEETVNIYGPKAFSFITDIEDALKSRTVEIPTIRVKDDPFGKVLANLARGLTRLDPLRREIMAFCQERLKQWPSNAVLRRLESPMLNQAVKLAVGPSAGPRDIELAAMCLLVADIADVDIAEDAKTAIDSQGIFEDEITNEIATWVKQSWGGRDYINIQELREGFNRTQKDIGTKPVHHKRFRAILREIGFREGEDLKRLARKGNHILVFTENVKRCLGMDGSPTQQESFTARPGWFTEVVDGSPSGEASLTMVKNQEEEVKELRKMCEALSASSEGGDGCFTVDAIYIKAEERKIDKDRVDKWVKHWSEKGDIYSPTLGKYKFT